MTNKTNKRKYPLYLEKHGSSLIDNGYLIHPVKPLQKGIFEDGWQQVRADKKTLDKWLEQGNSDCGIAILTRQTPAVDLDIRDEGLAQAMHQYVVDLLGDSITRVGQAPKQALLYRTDKPFKKVQSRTWLDWEETEHKVEILGDGQQVIAFNIHPGTRKPYEWLGDSPVDVAVDDLPTITREQAIDIVEKFESLAKDYGMEPKKRSRTSYGGYTADDSLDEDERALANYKPPRSNVTDEEIIDALEVLQDSSGEYETWVKVGMALYHQYQGDDKGLELWDEWSQNADNYDGTRRDKWDSFESSGDSTPATIGTLLALANEARRDERWSRFEDYKKEIDQSEHVRDLMEKIVPAIRKDYLVLDQKQRVALAESIKKRATKLGMSMPIGEVRKALRPKSKNGKAMSSEEVLAKHPWLEGWAWSEDDDMFVHPVFGKVTERSFNKKYEREMDVLASEEDASRYVMFERHLQKVFEPSFFATYVADIPKVRGEIYIPIDEPIIYIEGQAFVNKYISWQDRHCPPETKWTKQQRAAVERFKKLILSVCGGEGHEFERDIALSWLANKIQNPRRKSRYALFLVGPKGSGKTSLYATLVAILGLRNIGAVDPVEVESSFTGWAAQGCFSFVDEIDLSTRRDKEKIAQRLRAHISETLVRKVSKGQDGRRVPNFCDYIFASNRLDGLPVDEGERRLFVLMSEYNTRDEARRGMVESGFRAAFEDDLNDQDCLDAMFSLLMNYVPHEAFNPNDPPETEAKREATEYNRSAIADEVLSMMEDEDLSCINKDMVSIAHLRQALVQRSDSDAVDIDPRTNRNILGRVLSEPPFDLTRTARVRIDGRQYRLRYNPKEYKNDDEAKEAFTTLHELQAEAEEAADFSEAV